MEHSPTPTAYQSPDQQIDGYERLQETRNVVVFLGAEGSGKTSQAKLFAKQIGLPFLTYGDVFRNAAENDRTELGEECRRVFRDHDYIKLTVLKELIFRELKKEEYKNGVVIDGALRQEGESESFSDLLKSAGVENPNITVFFLRIPGWRAFERTIKRGRQDDTLVGMTGRLGAFYKGLGKRSSGLRKMSEEGKLRFFQIDATKTIDEVGQNVLANFNEKKI